MIIGYTFDGQAYPAASFAKMTEEAINYKEGIIDGIELTNTRNLINIAEGRMLVKGRQFKVLESETVNVEATESGELFCILIVEINLDKVSTEMNFNQVQFKVISSALEYPSLTKQDINSEKDGDTIYQYELARFKNTINGITDFQDMRTFLDFNSIYSAIQKEYRAILSNLKQELANVQDGSAYMLKNNITVLEGKITVSGNAGSNYIHGQETILFPDTFDAENCIVIALSLSQANHENFKGGYGTLASYSYSAAIQHGGIGKDVVFRKSTNDMLLTAYFQSIGIYQQDMSYEYDYKIVLMKI